MQKNLNMIYCTMFLLPVVGVFCFDNILFVWSLMELQMMCYVSLLVLKSSKSNYLMFFMVVQLFVGVLMFYYCFLTNIKDAQQYLITFLLMMSLLLKMGMYPFASWALKFISSLRGLDFWLFLTVLKIVPLVMCFYAENVFTFVLILFNWVYSILVLSHHSGYKKIIFFSSIANTAIFFTFMFMGFLQMAKVFLAFYFFYISMLIFFLEKSSFDFIFSGKKGENSFIMFLLIISLVGLPFLWGFSIKIFTLMSLFFSNGFFFYISLFVVSVVFSFFYMKLIFFFFLNNGYWMSNLSFQFFDEKSFFYFLFLTVFPLLMVTYYLMGNSMYI